jgi:hypothetical protein
VKRRTLGLICGVTAIAAALIPGLRVAMEVGNAKRFLPILEIAVAGVCVQYLFLLNAGRSAVQLKAPDEESSQE